jgi:hypothetical protein
MRSEKPWKNRAQSAGFSWDFPHSYGAVSRQRFYSPVIKIPREINEN